MAQSYRCAIRLQAILLYSTNRNFSGFGTTSDS
jgi:hypothetical protein